MFNLSNKVAAVFGAGSCGPGWGNGKASAVAYAQSGAKVAAIDFHEERASETAELIRAEGGTCIPLVADVTDAKAIKACSAQIEAQLGPIDILHNNVGINVFGSVIDISEEDWDKGITTDLKSAFLTCKYILPGMLERGQGVITNISSILSVRVSLYDQISYYAAKAGLNHFTQALAVRYADKGIRANAILPGLIDTPLLYENPDVAGAHGAVEQMIAARNATSPTGAMGKAQDVAHAAVFLASDEANYINGVLLPVDGGLICKQA